MQGRASMELAKLSRSIAVPGHHDVWVCPGVTGQVQDPVWRPPAGDKSGQRHSCNGQPPFSWQPRTEDFNWKQFPGKAPEQLLDRFFSNTSFQGQTPVLLFKLALSPGKQTPVSGENALSALTLELVSITTFFSGQSLTVLSKSLCSLGHHLITFKVLECADWNTMYVTRQPLLVSKDNSSWNQFLTVNLKQTNTTTTKNTTVITCLFTKYQQFSYKSIVNILLFLCYSSYHRKVSLILQFKLLHNQLS